MHWWRTPKAWMVGLVAVTVVVAGLASVLLTRSSPAVALPPTLQVGPGVLVVHDRSSSALGLTTTTTTAPPVLTTTTTSRVVIVNPQEPVTDSQDRGSGDGSSESGSSGSSNGS
jgi:hypothetical protein